MVSDMWQQGPALLENWNDDDILAQCKTLIPAGAYTTAHFLCSLAYLMLTQPELPRPSMIEGPDNDGFEKVVEEALRLSGPVHFRVRILSQDVELAGVTMKKGDKVFPVNAAANRDPRRYEHPAEVDTNRPGLRRHLAFNTGPRICAGAPLARWEAVTAMERLFTRLPDMAIDPSKPEPRIVGLLARSERPIHVRFTSR
jgi:cytochrome P450